MIVFQKNTIRPAFIIGACSYFFFLLGVFLRANANSTGVYLLGIGIGLGFVHWLWSLYDVFHNRILNAPSRLFWIILVMMVPPLGGMLYYIANRHNVKL